MAEEEIIQNMISRLGQSQSDRSPPELDPHFADIDERSAADLFSQARALAKYLRFYSNSPNESTGDWSTFFPDGDDTALLARTDGQVPPHLGLLIAFLRLYHQYPQQAINTITARHLDFQFRKVLHFKPKPAQPDHAHLLLELKKGISSLAIMPDMIFTAGKDDRGVELLYQPVREAIVGQGKVEALHSVFHNPSGIYFAPIANSKDGLGGELDAAQPKWSAFGHAKLSLAQIGFAIASPVLRMQEGTRKVKIDLWLSKVDSSKHTADKLSNTFEAYLTGPEGWLGPFAASCSVAPSNDKLTVEFTVKSTEPAIVDYDQSIHGLAFAAQAPVLRLQHEPEKTAGSLSYDDLKDLVLKSAQVTVTVDGLQNLTLENDDGSLNPKKAFLPFGSQPVAGSRFMIGCNEVLSKKLSNLGINLTWQGKPTDMNQWYSGYTQVGTANDQRDMDKIKARLTYQDSRKQYTQTISNILKFETSEPESNDKKATPSAHDGYIVVTLDDDFLHTDYLRETIDNTVNGQRGSIAVLNQPYTPKVQTISLHYEAGSGQIYIDNKEDFENPDLQFFHIGCFGQRREHAYLRSQVTHSPGSGVPLLPDYPDEGEFLIGISGASAGDSLNLLIQVAEGSADPALEPQQIAWSVLCDDYWRTLTPQELALDTSNNLRASGIVSIALPQETDTEHTWMSNGLVWLRASVSKNSTAACQLLSVSANAVEVRFADQGNDPAHLSSPLAAGKIAKFKVPRAEVKSVSQPYASFGGSPQEADGMLARRAAERLRHRNRCITPWDYERMLLEAFPNVHKVKCIPHASEYSWLAPGHLMLVAVPDLRNQNAVDQLQPRVDIDTLARMQDYAQQHAGHQVTIKTKNPHYQPVRLDFKVRFHDGYPFNHYRNDLEQALIRALTPWAYDKTREIEFGGRIYRSVLLDFVEELPYVDFVTDFEMRLVSDDGKLLRDAAEIGANTPDTIFVSNATHGISEFKDASPC